VYAPSELHVVVKFAAVSKKDKAELELKLNNEKAAYHKLSRHTRWVVLRHYAEYEWFGRRAPVLSDEGQSSSHLKKFSSLSLIEK